MNKTSPSTIDTYIGQRLKFRRAQQGKNLQELGDLLKVSFQQIQKYESGQNKISSSNLYLLSKYLKTDVSHFFEGIDKNTDTKAPDAHENTPDFEWTNHSMSDKELLSLIKYYSKIESTSVRKKILDLIKTL
jgi:transcriptional regulator with XRE-family HTH domain